MNQIIRESGSPKGSLYYYFPNGKEELAIEAVKLTRDFKIKEILDEIEDPVEALQSMVYGLARQSITYRRSSIYR